MSSKKLYSIIDEINNHGGIVYFVGGCVRDEFLSKKNKDIDIEIHNISVESVEEILQKFGKLDLVGKSFGILKIEGLPIDFAFPRKDNKVGNKHTSFESIVDPDLALDESARRRDFTMNAIMKNTRTKEILDPFNGVQDIHDRVIRLVDKRTFSEDPLRILRAAQFSARFILKLLQRAKN